MVTACVRREPIFFQNDVSGTSQNSQLAPIVSVLLPLSGESAEVGKSLQKAALLSLFEHETTPIKLLFFDTKSTPSGAKEAYQWAVAQKPNIVLGPVFSSEVMAIKEYGVSKPLLTFTSDTKVANDKIGTMAVLIPDQIRKLVQYACAQGHRKLAVLGPEDKTGEIAMNALSEAINMCPNMELQKISLYAGDTMNFTPAVLKILPKIIKDKGNLTPEEREMANTPMKDRVSFDALFVFESGVKLRQLASLLNFYEVNPRQIPTYGLATVKQINDRGINGIIFADVEDAGYTGFAREYKSQFGTQPIRLASLMYDALNLVFDRVETGGVSMETLRRTPYQGIDGIVQLLPDGTNQRVLQIVRKEGRGSVLLQSSSMIDMYDSFTESTSESVDSTSEHPEMLDESQDSFE